MGHRLRADQRLAEAILAVGPPSALAAFLVFVSPVAARANPGTRPLSALALILLATSALALVGWRAFPVHAYGLSLAFTALYVSLGYSPGPIFIAPFAGLLMLVATTRIATWTAGALIGDAGLALALAFAKWTPGILIFVVVWLAAVGLFAAGVGVRRAYQAEVTEREKSEARTKEEAALRRTAEERLRIAGEVHDVVGHSLAVISLQAGVAERLLRSDPDEAERSVNAIRDVSKQALTELRSELAQLRGETELAPVRTPKHGLAAVTNLVESMRSAGMAVAMEVAGAERAMPDAVAGAAYRVVQESLTNVARHAGPEATVQVRLRATDTSIEVEVLDTGRGRRTASRNGSGLRGMRDRVIAAGGSFSAGNRPGGGFRVRAVLPMVSE